MGGICQTTQRAHKSMATQRAHKSMACEPMVNSVLAKVKCPEAILAAFRQARNSQKEEVYGWYNVNSAGEQVICYSKPERESESIYALTEVSSDDDSDNSSVSSSGSSSSSESEGTIVIIHEYDPHRWSIAEFGVAPTPSEPS